MRATVHTRNANVDTSTPGGSHATSSSDDSSSPRHDKATSTPAFHKGGDVQYHLRSPPLRHLLFLLGAPLLCFLNGCAYYLFWRSRYLEDSATLHTSANTTGTPSSAVFVAPSSSAVAPGAFYGVTAGFAFAFVVTQWVIQASARAFIQAQTEAERATSFRRCGVLFEVAFLPLTIAQMVLIGNDYHLHQDTVWLLRLTTTQGGAGGASSVTRTALSSASHRYLALWIVSFLLTTTSMVVLASAMWADAAVTWLQRRVFAVHMDERRTDKAKD